MSANGAAASSGLPRILIPGGAGYIGSHVVLSVLLTRRYRVTVIDNYHNSFPTAIERVEKIALDELPADATAEQREACKVDVIKGDLRDRDVFSKAFAKYSGSDAIYATILVAALKAVGESGEIPIDYYDVNIGGLVNLLRAMRESGSTRLVYSSSATVYGTPEVIPIPETSPLQAESVYGRTKQMSEIIIKDICDAYPDFRAISLRYFNPAGAHPSGLIGEDPRGKPGNLLPLLSQMAVGKYREPGLKVFGNNYPTPDGTCVRDYIHVMDLSGGHVNALDALDNDARFQNLPSAGKYRAYNLGKGKGMSVLQMIEAMKKVTGYGYPYEIVGRRAGDVPDLTADPALAEKELGFKAKYSLDEMSRDLWNWQSNNPEGYGGQ
ncbi:UDP-glucose 4-epimerase [Microstroma glucosiphilum]|uniref:UDP-glucose 4-epimerase n=1 Tax=Pseudomicrostroma glucosiphilum TaxID=1684307 RepID=A0A316UKF0_9BASI|nr:UDP-glucose 4-epimerase [Pseudomicrostroma glucosiphilum]PWN23705.1 UDP-glucose 4-epimerase [Pseudomicrostroma glucosiphilum]